MAAGFGILRLEPRAFWSMTLPELSAAMRSVAGHAVGEMRPPGKTSLTALMQRFPDEGVA
ncbi:MAG: phage tail assembly chaperone [Hyphomicrobiaceae bacterium]